MNINEILRSIPKMDTVMQDETFKLLSDKYGYNNVYNELVKEFRYIRADIQSGASAAIPSVNNISQCISQRLNSSFGFHLKKVINATGIILHTNLGRAVLSREAAQHVYDISTSFCNLEYDIETGHRGNRISHIEQLLSETFGCEATLAVNNNAAAILLALCTVSNSRETLVSRGEIIEIGGSFRVPDIMEQSGTKLIEVGTTNKTRIDDYKRALNNQTGALLKVHLSNFKMTGFTESVSIEALCKLGREHNIPVIYDMGSSPLFVNSTFNLSEKPVASEVIRHGADIVTFSADKLFGGPQAGIILGKRSLIDRMKTHPLARVVRADKMTLAALEATLIEYRNADRALNSIPVLKMLGIPLSKLEERAGRLISLISTLQNSQSIALPAGTLTASTAPAGITVRIHAEPLYDNSKPGGGSLPEETLPTVCVALTADGITINELEQHLRLCEVPVIGHISKDKLLLDMRTVFDEEIEQIAANINIILKGGEQ